MRRIWCVLGCLGVVACADLDGDGVSGPADCDDGDVRAFKGAAEVCDGIDNDCDGYVDEDVSITAWQDRDGDGFGDPDRARRVCALPDDGVENGDDCDDLDPASAPDRSEVCDGRDNDCDGAVDEDVLVTFYVDADGDGHGSTASTTEACAVPEGYSRVADDCDDAVPEAWTDAPEQCDGLDNDCDGSVDEDLAVGLYPVDADGDGFGSATALGPACGAVEGFADNTLDCDDADASLNPMASEVPGNGQDDDCDTWVDESTVPGDYADIDAALAAVNDGAVIQLGAGLFSTQVDLSGRDLTLAGSGCGTTTLYADGGGTTVIMDGGVLAGMTIAGATESGVLISGDVTIRDACIEGNYSETIGGGVLVNAGDVQIIDTTFAYNLAGTDGGGLFVEEDAVVTGTRLTFVANEAGYDGGAIGIRSAVMSLYNSLFIDNQAYDDGGAIIMRKVSTAADGADVLVENCTFDSNTVIYDTLSPAFTSSEGSAIYAVSSSLDLRNGLFTHHELPGERVVYVTNNEFVSGYVGLHDNGEVDYRTGYDARAIREAPEYVYRDPGVSPTLWDLRLSPTSPYVDAGDPAILDRDGTRSDMGAFGGPESTLDFDAGYRLDQDGDGLADLWEIREGLEAWRADGAEDPDADGLDNAAELAAGTQPLSADSDDDGVTDGVEVQEGTDPTVQGDRLPVATVSGPTHVMVGETVSLDALRSFEPSGRSLTYAWSLDGPGTLSLSNTAGQTTSFVADSAGEWTVTLTVDSGLKTTETSWPVRVIAADVVVPDDQASLTTAVDLAADGDVIAVRPGIYDTELLLSRRAVEIVGLGSAEDVVIRGVGGPVGLVLLDATLTLRQLTISDGSAGLGGGIGCTDSTLVLSDVVFRDNQASLDGGALHLNGCTLTGVGVRFEGNSAGDDGGGIAAVGAEVALSQAMFWDNTAGERGGAIYASLGSNVFSLQNSVIQGNTAVLGAALWYSGSNIHSYMARFDHLAVVDNHASFGVIHLDQGRMRWFNGMFGYNSGTYLFDDNGPLHVLYPVIFDNDAVTWSVPADAPSVQYTLAPDVLSWVDDGDPTNDVWTLRPGSGFADRGHPDVSDFNGTRSGLGPASGAAPAEWWVDGVDGDGDGMSDGWEHRFGLDAHRDDGAGDLDGDGVSNLAEYLQGTLPDRADTDGDGTPD